MSKTFDPLSKFFFSRVVKIAFYVSRGTIRGKKCEKSNVYFISSRQCVRNVRSFPENLWIGLSKHISIAPDGFFEENRFFIEILFLKTS